MIADCGFRIADYDGGGAANVNGDVAELDI
jgi:hypothetical protein